MARLFGEHARCALAAVVFLSAAAPAQEQSGSPSAATLRTPVIVVPGLTGTRLENPRSGELVWGRTRRLLAPRDRGRSLALPLVLDAAEPHPQERYRPIGPVWRLNLGLWQKKIYGPLAAHLERTGYRLGILTDPGRDETLFFFDYDWRRSTVESALELASALERLRRERGESLRVDLICQSNASKICRYLVKFGNRDLAAAEGTAGSSLGAERHPGHYVRRVILVGASNDGALRGLAFFNRGRRYIPVFGRKIAPETFFTIRSLFDDLPADDDDLFFDPDGRTLEIDLYSAESWRRYGWSIFDRKVKRRLARQPRPELFATEDERLRYLERQLDRARRFQKLLAADSPAFPSVRYYRLENRSEPTMVRALLLERNGRWVTRFSGDRALKRDPKLAALAAAPGDGHASLESQRSLSPQEEATVAGTVTIGGGHFEMILEPEGLDAITAFLAE